MADIRQILLHGDGEELAQRRKLIALSAIGLSDFSLISLYQTGVIKNMPDLPGKIFDSNKVNAAPDAYLLGIPDGPISGLVYAAIIVLAAAGSSDNKAKTVSDTLLSGAIMGNATGAAYYMYNMIFKQKKVCIYCVAGALINFASAAIVAPIAYRSLKKLFGRKVSG